jgi:DNA-binding Lrp family transcriptional regulator
MLTGTNLVYTKRYNLRIVQEVIRLFGPLSRADIARRTELTGQTVSNLVRELIAAGIVAGSVAAMSRIRYWSDGRRRRWLKP